MFVNREYYYRQMEQIDVLKIYVDNLDVICILFMFFFLRNFIWMEKIDGYKIICYLFIGSIFLIREVYVLLFFQFVIICYEFVVVIFFYYCD